MNRREHLRRQLLVSLASAPAFALARPSLAQQPAAPALLLMRFHAPNLGSRDAKVHLVEFLDPACEGCRAFAPVVKAILAEHPGRVRLWVRHVPFHKGADLAVKALEAARLQGRYWEALDALFEKQGEWTRNHAAIPQQIIKVVEGAGVDVARIQRDMASPEIAKLLDQDMADAKALKIVQTPTFFVNGRPLQDYRFDQLRALVAEEVRRQYA